jgi:hypothetical protein
MNDRDGKEKGAMVSVKTPLTALLAIFDTSIEKIPSVAEVHAISDRHILRVCIADRCECARSAPIPILCDKVRKSFPRLEGLCD